MTRVTFHPEAETEFLAAARFYDAHTPGLGVDFVAEVRGAAQRLADYPELGHRFSRRLRRVLVHGFPYGLLFEHQGPVVVKLNGIEGTLHAAGVNASLILLGSPVFVEDVPAFDES